MDSVEYLWKLFDEALIQTILLRCTTVGEFLKLRYSRLQIYDLRQQVLEQEPSDRVHKLFLLASHGNIFIIVIRGGPWILIQQGIQTRKTLREFEYSLVSIVLSTWSNRRYFGESAGKPPLKVVQNSPAAFSRSQQQDYQAFIEGRGRCRVLQSEQFWIFETEYACEINPEFLAY